MNNASELFGNIASKDYLGFRLKGNQTNYAKVAQFLEFERSDLSKIAGIAQSSVRFDEKIPRELRDRVEEIANICLLVAEHFKDEHKTALWFRAINPHLGGISPKDMLRLGRYKKLMQFVMDALSRNKRSD